MAQGFRALLIAAALGSAGCGGCGNGAGAEAVDVTAGTAAEAIDRVLDHCHARLRGTLSHFECEVTFAGGDKVQCFVELPDRVRVQGAQGTQVLNGADAFAADSGDPVPAADRERLLDLLALVDAGALGPLYRATGSARGGDDARRLEIETATAGYRATLQADAWRLASLHGPRGTFTFRGHLRTSVTWIPQDLDHERLGACRLRFAAADVHWDPAIFARRTAAPTTGNPAPDPAGKTFEQGGEARPTTPMPGNNRAQRWVVFDDPGTWDARTRAIVAVQEVLTAQNQQLVGFPGFVREAGRDRVFVAFRQRQDGPALQAPAGWQLREVPAQKILLVFPDGTGIDERIAAGRRLLGQAIAARGMPPEQPILVQPYLRYEEGVPAGDKLATAVVRMCVPLPR